MEADQDIEPKSLGESTAFSTVPACIVLESNPCRDVVQQPLLHMLQPWLLKTHKRIFLSSNTLALSMVQHQKQV